MQNQRPLAKAARRLQFSGNSARPKVEIGVCDARLITFLVAQKSR